MTRGVTVWEAPALLRKSASQLERHEWCLRGPPECSCKPTFTASSTAWKAASLCLAFMALFGRERLPSRSTLSRFLATLTQPPVEALHTLFLEDLLARPLNRERQIGGLVDRAGSKRVVFDIDGTREAAHQRALPKTPELPAPRRQLEQLCAPGYSGRKRGEVVRTRTTVSQAHTSQWLGSFATITGGGH